jgi:hypothetical protein
MTLKICPLTSDLWAALEDLFGELGGRNGLGMKAKDAD